MKGWEPFAPSLFRSFRRESNFVFFFIYRRDARPNEGARKISSSLPGRCLRTLLTPRYCGGSFVGTFSGDGGRDGGSSHGTFGRCDGWRATWQDKKNKNRERFVRQIGGSSGHVPPAVSPSSPFSPGASSDKVFHFPHPLSAPSRGKAASPLHPLAGLAPRLPSSPILPLNYGSQISRSWWLYPVELCMCAYICVCPHGVS